MSINEVPYKKCRINGVFTLQAQPDDRVWAKFEGTFCGKAHSGNVFFERRGAKERRDGRYLRVGSFGTPTYAASDALVAAAQDVATIWATAHPEAFDAAELAQARSDAERADAVVADLEGKLAEARREAAAAHAHLHLLEAR